MRYGFRKMPIGGKRLEDVHKEVFPAVDPGIGEVLAEVARSYEDR
jgi:hypothetical protein